MSMESQAANLLQRGFKQQFAQMGTLCDAGGQQRKVLKGKKDNYTTFAFPEEFPLKNGDRIRELATESYFTVLETEPVSGTGVFLYFRAITQRVA